MDVRPVQAMAPYRAPAPGTTAPGTTAPSQPSDLRAPQQAQKATAAEGSGPDRDKTRYVRDADSNAIVFQVFDPTYGEVLAQMPSVSALRNRAYADAARAMMAQRTSKGTRAA